MNSYDLIFQFFLYDHGTHPYFWIWTCLRIHLLPLGLIVGSKLVILLCFFFPLWGLLNYCACILWSNLLFVWIGSIKASLVWPWKYRKKSQLIFCCPLKSPLSTFFFFICYSCCGSWFCILDCHHENKLSRLLKIQISCDLTSFSSSRFLLYIFLPCSI